MSNRNEPEGLLPKDPEDISCLYKPEHVSKKISGGAWESFESDLLPNIEAERSTK